MADLSVEQIRESVARLHSTAWHGRREASEAAHKVEPPADFVARFSIPRQPTDDDEIVYAAIEELRRLRDLATAARTYVTSLDEAARLASERAPQDSLGEAVRAGQEALDRLRALVRVTDGEGKGNAQ